MAKRATRAPSRANAGGGARHAAPARRAPAPLAPALAAAAVLVLHAARAGSPFFADDWLFLDQVRARSLPAALRSPDPIGNFFRPLGRALWFWLLAHATGESPLAFHLANLALFVACVLLLWALARQVAGRSVAAVAAALFALTQAADVPVRWASGSQDLLAVALALGAMLALARGRRWLAAVLVFAAPLAKEIAALAVVPAALLARRRGEPWRATLARAAPAGLATLAWAACALAYAARHPHANPLTLGAAGLLAAPVNLVRTLLGIEWSTGGAPFTPPGALALGALALATIAVLADGGAAPARAPGPPAAARRDLLAGAAAWALAGALPVAGVAAIWSGYFYLFALAGVALLLGLVLAPLPRLATAALVLALGWAGQRAGALPEFATAPGAFSAQSHVNDFYLDRGMSEVRRWVGAMRRDDPRLPPRTTVFFSGAPGFAAIQVGDGPLVRGVYRDSSLRSYYLTQLSPERLRRGPVRFVLFDPNTHEVADETSDSTIWLRVAMGELLNGREAAARAALAASSDAGEVGQVGSYLSAFMALDAGDVAAGLRLLARAGCAPGRDGSAALADARAHLAAADTAGALAALVAATQRSALDPRLHAAIADLQLAEPRLRHAAPLESYITRVLAPRDPASWRRWAYTLYWTLRMPEAGQALDRYFALAPRAAVTDPDAVALRAQLQRMLPGGDLQQRAIRVERPQ